jgi:hypothetical protein
VNLIQVPVELMKYLKLERKLSIVEIVMHLGQTYKCRQQKETFSKSNMIQMRTSSAFNWQPLRMTAKSIKFKWTLLIARLHGRKNVILIWNFSKKKRFFKILLMAFDFYFSVKNVGRKKYGTFHVENRMPHACEKCILERIGHEIHHRS